ncbi:DNA-processing protein DprA [Gemella morbillorum]
MECLEKKKYWIWFSLIKGLGCVRKNKLLQLYGTPEKIYKLNKSELLKIDGIGEETATNIINSKNERLLNYHIQYMKQNNIDIIHICEKSYPQLLKQIYDAPVSLYIRGNKEVLNGKSIGVVGCRNCTDYGKKAAKYFAYNLAKEESINIDSGLAKGVDSYAHWGSVGANIECESTKNCGKKHVSCGRIDNYCGNLKNDCGKTIAVLGNGLDMIYPKENIKLVNEIIRSGGAIISEYPCGTKPDKMNFPARNRIISGISDGIIVIEAKEKSGTLITVDFALEQGRDVFVVPGNINSINSVGTNDLIKQGAKMVTSYMDIK